MLPGKILGACLFPVSTCFSVGFNLKLYFHSYEVASSSILDCIFRYTCLMRDKSSASSDGHTQFRIWLLFGPTFTTNPF